MTRLAEKYIVRELGNALSFTRLKNLARNAVFEDTSGPEMFRQEQNWRQPLAEPSAISRRWHKRQRGCKG